MMKKNYKTPCMKQSVAIFKTSMLGVSETKSMGIYGSERQMNASSALGKQRDDWEDGDVEW